MLELERISVAYEGHLALRDVDLRAAEREVVAVLGPSGCGKSTLLRAVAGLEPLAGGRVHLGGRDVTDRPPHERDVGLAFQDAVLFPHRTVAQNVGFGPRMRGWPRAQQQQRVAEVLELVDLAHAADRRVSALSGGEAQRISLARAIAPRPRLLLLDEPLGALDRVLRDRLLGELPAVFTDAGATVLHVTHDHVEALTLADRVAVLVEGRLRRVDTPERLWRDPRSIDVADVLGLDQRHEVTVTAGGVEGPEGTWPVANGLPAGSRAQLLVPPDAVALTDASTPGARRVTVEDRRFRGDRVVLGVRTAAGTRWRVDAAGRRHGPGDEAWVDLDVDALRVLAPAPREDPGSSRTR